MMQTTATSSIEREIREVNNSFEECFGNSDAAAIASLYTNDATLMPPGLNFIKGTEAIKAFWQEAMNMGIKQAMLETLEVQQHDNVAIETGTYSLFGEGQMMLDKGKYLVVWKKENGKWRLHKDIWNTSMSAS